METENKAPEEEKDKKSEPEKTPAETAPEKPSEAAPEAAKETTPESGETAAPAESEQPESEPESAPDNIAELEQLRSENARLKAQLEAHGAGFKAEYIEDAVLIAENAAKRDGITITEALQAVAKKYPEVQLLRKNKTAHHCR